MPFGFHTAQAARKPKGGTRTPCGLVRRSQGQTRAECGFQRRWLIPLLALVLLASGCVIVPSGPPVPVAMSAEQRAAYNLKTFDRAWDLVDRKFFDATFRGVDWKAMRDRYRPEAEQAPDTDKLYAVINTMLAELKESHVGAISPQRQFEERTRQQALVGVGFQKLEGQWVVNRVFPGSPAEAAGVRRGWLFVTRNGKPLEADAPKPQDGDVIVFEFLDEHDQPRLLTLTARMISTEFRPEVRELADGVVYLRFDRFNLASLRWLSAQLRAHRAAPALVIDLRQNPGGYRLALDFSLGEFFPKAVPLGTFVARSGAKNDEAASQWFSARYAGRVALLVSGGSASCAEIFAHVLHHHRRAVVVGQKTAGAVIVSLDYPLPDGGRVQVPIEDYLGLDGKRLEGNGVTPDVTVETKLADIRAGIDVELEAALQALRAPSAAMAQTH